MVLRVAQVGLVLLFVIAAVLGTLSGVLVAFAGDVPEISALDDYRPNTITRIVARDGQTIGEFATEDAGFNQHFGVSMPVKVTPNGAGFGLKSDGNAGGALFGTTA